MLVFRWIQDIEYQLSKSKLGSKELHLVYRNLYQLISAGISYADGFENAEQWVAGPYKVQAMRNIRASLKQGKGLAESIYESKIFPHFDVILVQSAEIAGKVTEVIERLALKHKEKYQLQQNTKKQMSYPGFIMVSAIFLLGIPGLVKGEVTMSQYVFGNFAILGLIIALIFFTFKGYKVLVEEPNLQGVNQFLMRRVPVLGTFLKTINLEEYFFTMALLVDAGVSLVQAAEQAAKMSKNLIVKRAAAGVYQSLQDGALLKDAFQKEKFFPREFIPLLHTAEISGKYTQCFQGIAEQLKESGQRQQKTLTAVIPKVIYFGSLIYIGYVVLMAQQERLDAAKEVLGMIF